MIRPAERRDVAALHDLIVALAVYEREPDAVTAIASDLEGRASESDAACFSSVDANAAGDESRRFLRRRLTKAVPKPLPAFSASFSRLAQ